MNVFKQLRNCFHLFNKRAAVKQEIDEELCFHIEQRVAENVAAGMSQEDAEREARKRFGNMQTVREDGREKSRANLGETVWQDFRFAARMLRKNRGFTAVAVVSLGLGIGAATAIFSLINAILLQSLPVSNPQELRVLHWSGIDAHPHSISGQAATTGNRTVAECVSPPMFLAMRQRAAGLADVFAFAPLEDPVVRARHEAFATTGMIVSDNFFSALGVRPLIGQVFTPSENPGDAVTEVVISYEQWERQFGKDPGAVGQSITLDGHNLTVIGVLPDGFSGVELGKSFGFYVPLAADSPFAQRAVSSSDHWWVRLMARLKPNASDAQLKAVLDTAFAPVAQSQMKQPQILVQPGAGGLAYDRKTYGKPLMLLLAIVGLVLLVACANIAGLTLARGAARQHELAVRAALGAGRWRLIRQSLVESLLLALIGGGLGILIATQGKTVVTQLLTRSTEGFRYDSSIDLTILGFSLAIAVITAFLSGLLPAWRAGQTDPVSGLKSRTTLGAPRLRTGRVLVVTQIGLSLMLLSVAGLFVRTLLNLREINPGFNTQKLLVFQLNPSFAGYQDAQIVDFYGRVQSSLAAIPGVRGAALTLFPLLNNIGSSGGFTYGDRSLAPGENPTTSRLVVGENFFSTMGLPVLQGRGLRAADTQDAAHVIVVNEKFAKKYFPNHDAIGHTINTWRSDWRIVGICQNARYENIKEPVPPTIYIPFRQFPLHYGAWFVVRTALPPMALASAVRKAVAAIDPNIPVTHLTTQEQLISGTINREHLFATMCAALAGFALVLSCIGLYGLLSFSVARRTGEIGVRMALGALPRDVARVILREALILAAIGASAGLVLVLAVTRLIRSQLYDVAPADPLTLTCVIATLVMVALISAWLPARRAARVNPVEALRCE